MRYLSRSELAQVAQPVLREYWKLPEAQEHPWYVDPALLAKEVLGLKVLYRQLSWDGELLGLTSFGEAEVFLPDSEIIGPCVLDGRTVLVEDELSYAPSGPGRLHFTIAHECSHHIMYRLYPEDYGEEISARLALPYWNRSLYARGGGRDTEEWQMDVLAAELLMPEVLVRRNLKMVGLPDGFEILNPVWRRKDFACFEGLCRTMQVSKQAMAYRLERLGLLRSNQIDCPMSMLDIMMEEEEMAI